jgi:tetratricopeptide (TPR) repeat protein
MRHTSFVRALLLSGVFASAAHGAPAAEAPWVRVSTSDFTLISAQSLKETEAHAATLREFIAAFQQLVPFDRNRLMPMTIVIFDKASQMEPYLFRRTDGSIVQGDYGYNWVGRTLSGKINGSLRRADFNDGLYYLAGGWVLRGVVEDALPRWVTSGFSKVVSDFTIAGPNVIWGQMDANELQMINRSRMPLQELLRLSDAGLQLDDRSRSVVGDQARALVHFLLFSGDQQVNAGFRNYLRNYRPGANREEQFQAAFGFGVDALGSRLASYLERGRYRELVMPRPQLESVGIESRPASVSEVDHALGIVAAVTGSQEIALDHAARLLAADPDSPFGYEVRHLAYQMLKLPSQSMEAAASAAERRSRSETIYRDLGREELRAAGQAPSPGRARAISNHFKRAINLFPYSIDAYQSIAALVEHVEGDLASDRRFLDLGRRIYPQDPLITAGLAIIAYRTGSRDEAMRLAETIAANDNSPEGYRARAMIARLTSPPPAWRPPLQRSKPAPAESQTVENPASAPASGSTASTELIVNRFKETLKESMGRGDLAGAEQAAHSALNEIAAHDESREGMVAREFLEASLKMVQARSAFFVRKDLAEAGRLLQELLDSPTTPDEIRDTAALAMTQVERERAKQ